MTQISIFTISISLLFWYFAATLLQWHAYQFSRVLLKFHKKQWLLIYFIAPYSLFLLGFILNKEYILAPIALCYTLVALYLWHRQLDKKLVFTGRVKRFLAIFIATSAVLIFFYKIILTAPILSILIANLISTAIERRLAREYEQKALQKLKINKNLKVVAITASYGKTSIKNFLARILSTKFAVYATPRSVNTRVGILKDINEGLPDSAEVYIVEAGARAQGDILEITELVEPHIAVIGKIGPAHIEYFKSIENIISTKTEILVSKRLQRAFVFENVGSLGGHITPFGFNQDTKISNLISTLDGLSFDLQIDYKQESFHAPILGSFNAINISAAILVANELGMSFDEIREAVSKLPPVEHRLQRIDAAGKVILDDSFNGNVDGMSEAIELCKTFAGTKVIVTPGLVEASQSDNKKIANMINESFDLVILTGSLNVKLYDEIIKTPRKIILQNKTDLVNTLGKETKAGDLIYFANDAPSYI